MMAFGTPTEDTVMRRAAIDMSLVMKLMAARTERIVSSGSPIPINTAMNIKPSDKVQRHHA